MNTVSLIGILLAISAIGMFWAYNARKKDTAKALTLFTVVLAVMFVAVGGLASLGVDFAIGGAEPSVQPVTPSGCSVLDSVKLYAKDKYTMANADQKFALYTKGADVTNPNTVALSTDTITSGVATDASYFFSTCTDQNAYDLWFNGQSTDYNEKIPAFAVTGSAQTGKGTLTFAGLSYYPAIKFGTFTDFDTVQSSTSASVLVDSGTDTFAYDKSAGSNGFYASWLIGNDGANTELHDVVFCMQDANTGVDAFEGDEISSIAVSYISGTNVDKYNLLAGDIVSFWQSSAGSGSYVCKKLADNIGSNANGEYKFTVTLDETNWVTTNEQVKMCLDDLGNYGALQYPSANAKATASCVTIATQA